MTNPSRTICIGNRTYRLNPEVDRYQVPYSELGDLRMRDIPPHSHLEILEMPGPRGATDIEVYGLNAGDEGEIDELCIYGGASFRVPLEDGPTMLLRLRRAFPDMDPDGRSFLRNPWISSEVEPNGLRAHVHLDLKFKDAPDMLVRDAVSPFIEGFQRLDRPSTHLFICHASEDKKAARELANAMKRLGAEVWFDEWELRVGDSIVEKINAALGTVSHLLVLLSYHSVAKPWVNRELSAALMRQLSTQGIQVLPIRLDDCTIPPILADIRYADARKGMRDAVAELEKSLFFLKASEESV